MICYVDTEDEYLYNEIKKIVNSIGYECCKKSTPFSSLTSKSIGYEKKLSSTNLLNQKISNEKEESKNNKENNKEEQQQITIVGSDIFQKRIDSIDNFEIIASLGKNQHETTFNPNKKSTINIEDETNKKFKHIYLPKDKEKLVGIIDKKIIGQKKVYLFFGLNGGLGISSFINILNKKMNDSIIVNNSPQSDISDFLDLNINEKIIFIKNQKYKNLFIDGISTFNEFKRLYYISKKVFIWIKNNSDSFNRYRPFTHKHDLIVRNTGDDLLEKPEIMSNLTKNVFIIDNINTNNILQLEDDSKYLLQIEPIINYIKSGKVNKSEYKVSSFLSKIKEIFLK